MDASELHARRLNAKEVLTPQRSGNFIFPVADGTVKIFGGEQRLRTSTLTQERPERGEEQEILQGQSNDLHSPTPLQEDSPRDDEEVKTHYSLVRKFIPLPFSARGSLLGFRWHANCMRAFAAASRVHLVTDPQYSWTLKDVPPVRRLATLGRRQLG